MTCSIPNCGKKLHSKGLCSTHYSIWRRAYYSCQMEELPYNCTKDSQRLKAVQLACAERCKHIAPLPDERGYWKRRVNVLKREIKLIGEVIKKMSPQQTA